MSASEFDSIRQLEMVGSWDLADAIADGLVYGTSPDMRQRNIGRFMINKASSMIRDHVSFRMQIEEYPAAIKDEIDQIFAINGVNLSDVLA